MSHNSGWTIKLLVPVSGVLHRRRIIDVVYEKAGR